MGPPRLHVIFSRIQETAVSKESDDGRETWALLWKTNSERQETVVLVGFLFPKDQEQSKGYQDTIGTLKLEAKKAGCSDLTDRLDVVKLKRGYHNQRLWWLELFENDQPSDMDQYQFVHFGLDSSGERKNYLFPLKDRNTEWSSILHFLNNSNAIEEIVRRGRIPDDFLKLSPKNDTTSIKDEVIRTESNIKESSRRSFFFSSCLSMRTFVSNTSMTILHLGNLNSMRLSSIAMVRCAQTFLTLRNSNTNKGFHRLLPSQTELSKERTARWNAFLSAFFDMLLGFAVGAILSFMIYNHQESLVTPFRKLYQYLEEHIAWLETFPAGFKLNVQLTHTMGFGIRSLLDRYKGFLFRTIWDPQICHDYLLPTLAMIGAVGGWTTFLAVLVDLWRLEIIFFTCLALCFRKLYQAELYLLSALFRLFRGKKRNPLRHRTDSMKYDAMQLLVGTIAFCVCVFLWTTVMVYYTFFVLCNLLMHLPLMFCSVLYLLSRHVPFGSLLFRALNPHWFPQDLYIQTNYEIKTTNSKFRIQVGELVPTLESPASIVSCRTQVPLKHLFNWYMVSFLEVLFPRSGRKLHSFLPLTLLVDKSKI